MLFRSEIAFILLINTSINAISIGIITIVPVGSTIFITIIAIIYPNDRFFITLVLRPQMIVLLISCMMHYTISFITHQQIRTILGRFSENTRYVRSLAEPVSNHPMLSYSVDVGQFLDHRICLSRACKKLECHKNTVGFISLLM